jgi:hypothetical protein
MSDISSQALWGKRKGRGCGERRPRTALSMFAMLMVLLDVFIKSGTIMVDLAIFYLEEGSHILVNYN